MVKEYNFDFSDVVLGRASSYVAKLLLEGNKVNIYNAEKAVITGNKEIIFEKYRERRNYSGKGNPLKGPKYPRKPDAIVRRVIRGMLPFKTARGREAFRRLKVYVSKDDSIKLESLDSYKVNPLRKHIKMAELSKFLGAKW